MKQQQASMLYTRKTRKIPLLSMTKDKLRVNPMLPVDASQYEGNGGKERFK